MTQKPMPVSQLIGILADKMRGYADPFHTLSHVSAGRWIAVIQEWADLVRDMEEDIRLLRQENRALHAEIARRQRADMEEHPSPRLAVIRGGAK